MDQDNAGQGQFKGSEGQCRKVKVSLGCVQDNAGGSYHRRRVYIIFIKDFSCDIVLFSMYKNKSRH
jgi:hypothetical protein